MSRRREIPPADPIFAHIELVTREHQAHVLQHVGHGIEDKRVLHATMLGHLHAYADFLRVTYGPEKAAETFFVLANDIIAKAKPAELPIAQPSRRRWPWTFGKR